MQDTDGFGGWYEAYGPCPFGCPFDADAYIDPETGCPVEWRCRVCDEQRAIPTPYSG